MKKPRIIDQKKHSKIKQSEKAEDEKLGAWLAESPLRVSTTLATEIKNCNK
jgi:hypothetical protein